MPAIAVLFAHAHVTAAALYLHTPTSVPLKKKPKPTPTPTPSPTDSASVNPDPSSTPLPSGTPTPKGGNTKESALSSILAWLISHPILPLLLIAYIVVATWGWKKLTLNYNMSGRALPTLGSVVSRTIKLIYKEDTTPFITKPAKLAQKAAWLTWKRYWQFLTVLTLINAIGLLHNIPLWVINAALILIGSSHAHTIFRRRHRILMQMFEVANSECRYPKGAELNPWGWVNISNWKNIYQPETTVVVFPARFRAEDPRIRETFETNFNSTVTDANTWIYKWESANNRVIVTPVPFITTQAPYPFPDTHEWDQIPVGIQAGNEETCWNLTTYPHLLIAGVTGSGKSVTQRTILLHVLQSPKWRVCLIDPKRVELSSYRGHPNVLKVATELEESTALFEQVEQEMQSRYLKMSEAGVNHFMSLADPPPALMVMVDETFALLSPENIKSDEGKERDEMHGRCTVLIGSIARLGRAAGVHLVLATQRPDAKVIPGETRANLDARIAQGRMDTTPSLMTLDSDAATRTPNVKGRAVLRTGNSTTEFQAYFLPNEALGQVMEMSAAIAQGVISAEDLLAAVREAEGGGKGGGGGPSALSRLFSRIPLPTRVTSGFKDWVERRKQVVEENEGHASRYGESRAERKAERKAGRKGAQNDDMEVPPRRSDPSVSEVAAEVRASGGGRVESELFSDADGEDFLDDDFAEFFDDDDPFGVLPNDMTKGPVVTGADEDTLDEFDGFDDGLLDDFAAPEGVETPELTPERHTGGPRGAGMGVAAVPGSSTSDPIVPAFFGDGTRVTHEPEPSDFDDDFIDDFDDDFLDGVGEPPQEDEWLPPAPPNHVDFAGGHSEESISSPSFIPDPVIPQNTPPAPPISRPQRPVAPEIAHPDADGVPDYLRDFMADDEEEETDEVSPPGEETLEEENDDIMDAPWMPTTPLPTRPAGVSPFGVAPANVPSSPPAVPLKRPDLPPPPPPARGPRERGTGFMPPPPSQEEDEF